MTISAEFRALPAYDDLYAEFQKAHDDLRDKILSSFILPGWAVRGESPPMRSGMLKWFDAAFDEKPMDEATVNAAVDWFMEQGSSTSREGGKGGSGGRTAMKCEECGAVASGELLGCPVIVHKDCCPKMPPTIKAEDVYMMMIKIPTKRFLCIVCGATWDNPGESRHAPDCPANPLTN